MSAETVQLPKDREGRTLHINDEVIVFRDGKPIAQGEVTGMTVEMLNPAIWFVCLYRGYRRQALSDKLRWIHA